MELKTLQMADFRGIIITKQLIYSCLNKYLLAKAAPASNLLLVNLL